VKGNVTDQSQQEEVLRFHENARKFWEKKALESNVD